MKAGRNYQRRRVMWFCGHFLRLCRWEELPDSHQALLWDSHLFPDEDEGMRSPALWIKWQSSLAMVVLCILGCEGFPSAGCENWAGLHLGFSQTEQAFSFLDLYELSAGSMTKTILLIWIHELCNHCMCVGNQKCIMPALWWTGG